MAERDKLPPIKYEALAAALLARATTIVPAWLPGGVQRGHEYVCGSLSGGAGSSCSVNLTTGAWADFAADELRGNDLISLYAAIHDLPMWKAALEVARAEGLEDVAGIVTRAGGDVVPRPPRPAPEPKPVQKQDEGWRSLMPVPDTAPAPTFKHQYRQPEDIEHKATYSKDGYLLGYVVRFRTSDGGKDTLPYTWCVSARDGAARWHWKQWDEPRPLYLPGGKTPSEQQTVVLVEGEKKADVLQGLLEAGAPGVYVVVSWPGGSKAWKKASWQWLTGRHVLLWPDCDGKRELLTKKEREACGDEAARDIAQAAKPLLPVDKQPGMAAMLGIGAALELVTCTVRLLPIPEPLTVPDGWDCADAILTDGWDFERVINFFAQAQPLPKAPQPDAEPAPEKKRVGPGDPGDGGDAPGGDLVIGRRVIPWWLACYYDKPNKRWLASRKMVIAILENDETLQDVLAYNELSNNVQARVAWPWPHAKAGNVTNAVDLLLGDYLTDRWGLPSISRAALQEAIQTVAHKRRFHPIRDYLQGLKRDGISRIDKWLMFVLGETPETLPKPMQEYLGLVGRFWLLGMVNRVMHPGCKFDYCPVLEGAGGLRKSTMVEVLAGAGYYSDTPFEVGRGKEAQEQVQGLWVYEIAELTHFSKAEVGAIKAFISSKLDRYREAYGSTLSEFPRQCVLVGTTNENTYLRDRTGNRRFWPIPVRNRINTEWLAKWRDQLLAEAYALYLEGADYAPTPDQERRLFVPMQESRLVETAVVSELQRVLTRDSDGTASGKVVNNLADFLTIGQLTLALGVDAAKSSPALEGQIRAWLEHEGWQRVKKQINGVRAWGYERPKDWPPADDAEGMVPKDEPGEPSAPTPPSASTSTMEGDDAPF